MEAGTRQGSGVAGVVTAERARPSDRWPGARGRSRLVTAVSWPERLLTHARRAARAQALALGRAGRPPGFTVRVAVDTVLSFSVPQCSYLLMGTGILGAAARFERVQPPRAEEGARGTAAGPAEVRKRPLIMFSVLGRAVRPWFPSLRSSPAFAHSILTQRRFPIRTRYFRSKTLERPRMGPEVRLEGPPWSGPPRPGRLAPQPPRRCCCSPTTAFRPRSPPSLPLPWDGLVHILSVENPATESCSC